MPTGARASPVRPVRRVGRVRDGRLSAAGWTVTRQEFQFRTFESLSDSVLERVAPPPAGPLEHSIMSYSGSGDVTASVSTPSGDSRGCLASDFTGFPVGNIALIQRVPPPASRWPARSL